MKSLDAHLLLQTWFADEEMDTSDVISRTKMVETHALRFGQENAMKAIRVALAYVLRTAPLAQLKRADYHIAYLKA
ncbi:hypothetical protein Tco_0605951, partial [Tanacetum coccineum]